MLRLVGLYHANRGAHTYFFKVQQVPRPGDYVVNLLHYEDAADLAVQVWHSNCAGDEGAGPGRGLRRSLSNVDPALAPTPFSWAARSQVLNGSGSGPFRHKVFLGSDNNPVTFKVWSSGGPRLSGRCATGCRTAPSSCHRVHKVFGPP